MENKTVNTDLWYRSGNFGNCCSIYHSDGEFGNSIANNVENNNADLIVTAINACKAINPGNPLKAAEWYQNIINIAKCILPILQDCKKDWNTEYEYAAIKELEYSLKQATE